MSIFALLSNFTLGGNTAVEIIITDEDCPILVNMAPFNNCDRI